MNRVKSASLSCLLWLVFGIAAPLLSQEKGGDGVSGPYEVVVGWPENPCGEGYRFGSTSGIFAESPDRVFIFQRGCLPEMERGDEASIGMFVGRTEGYLLAVPNRNASRLDLSEEDPSRHPRWEHILYVVNRDGKMIESWDQYNDLFIRPHKVLISPYDPEGHVWVVDDGAHQVWKFTNDGKKIVMELGEFKVPGNDESHFWRPTDIAWLPDGTFFVSDGYTNTRVVKFDKDGNFLMTWGKKGNPPDETRPGYMNTVHSIAVDSERHVYIADRANRRIQVFDENGEFLDVWPGIRRPYYLYMAADQHLWVSDGVTQLFTKFDLNGKLLYGWGSFGTFPGGFWGVHQFSVDQEGNLYTADVHIGRPQKFRPREDADPSMLIGQRVGMAR